MVEFQSDYQIQKLKSDKGEEYTSLEFHSFCDHLGLERQLTVACSLQQNSVVEMRNMTIVEMGKSMLHDKNLPHNF